MLQTLVLLNHEPLIKMELMKLHETTNLNMYDCAPSPPIVILSILDIIFFFVS
jgi:hypothetical protein